jgi:RHS repeat-associated protein
MTALAGWVSYPSSCTWTASGGGGSTTYTETMTTVAGTNSSVTYIYTDGLGSPVARTDANGAVISRTRYEPYGYVASGVQPTIGFTGHVNDVDTGLTYMQQRYYDPVAGRFLSIDPVVTDSKSGTSFNRYAYAVNNPYKYIDPDGRDPGELTAWPVPSSGVLNKADKPGEGDGHFGTKRAGGARSHTGIDIQAKDGAKVVAAGDGKVVNIQPNPSAPTEIKSLSTMAMVSSPSLPTSARHL